MPDFHRPEAATSAKKRLVGHADLKAVGKSRLCRVTAVSEAACVAPLIRPASSSDMMMSAEDDTADDQS